MNKHNKELQQVAKEMAKKEEVDTTDSWAVEEKKYLQAFFKLCPNVEKARKMVLEFQDMMKQKKPELPDTWIENALIDPEAPDVWEGRV